MLRMGFIDRDVPLTRPHVVSLSESHSIVLTHSQSHQRLPESTDLVETLPQLCVATATIVW
jgi:hypothetical protein